MQGFAKLSVITPKTKSQSTEAAKEAIEKLQHTNEVRHHSSLQNPSAETYCLKFMNYKLMLMLSKSNLSSIDFIICYSRMIGLGAAAPEDEGRKARTIDAIEGRKNSRTAREVEDNHYMTLDKVL